MVYLGLMLLKHFPCYLVDSLMVMLSKIRYGDLSKYGIQRPREGPFALKVKYGKYPVIDVGTCKKIKSGEIQVNFISFPLNPEYLLTTFLISYSFFYILVLFSKKIK